VKRKRASSDCASRYEPSSSADEGRPRTGDLKGRCVGRERRGGPDQDCWGSVCAYRGDPSFPETARASLRAPREAAARRRERSTRAGGVDFSVGWKGRSAQSHGPARKERPRPAQNAQQDRSAARVVGRQSGVRSARRLDLALAARNRGASTAGTELSAVGTRFAVS